MYCVVLSLHTFVSHSSTINGSVLLSTLEKILYAAQPSEPELLVEQSSLAEEFDVEEVPEDAMF